MANPELVQALDYILNRSDEASIEVLAAAVVRRRRDIAMFGGGINVPDPKRMAQALSSQINESIGVGVEGLKSSIRDMAVRIIRQEAPDLTDEQIAELTGAWIPDTGKNTANGSPSKMPRNLLASMIDQFVSFSRGTMNPAEDKQLRDELGAWPQRYWKAFPPVICSIITDFLKDKIPEQEFNSKIGIALEM
jgi:hypothetical protein